MKLGSDVKGGQDSPDGFRCAPDIWDGDSCSGVALLSHLISGCSSQPLLCHSSWVSILHQGLGNPLLFNQSVIGISTVCISPILECFHDSKLMSQRVV